MSRRSARQTLVNLLSKCRVEVIGVRAIPIEWSQAVTGRGTFKDAAW
jgi:hypothetical protein